MILSLKDFRFSINILHFNLIYRFLSCVIIKHFQKNDKIYKLNIIYNMNVSLRLKIVYMKIEN